MLRWLRRGVARVVGAPLAPGLGACAAVASGLLLIGTYTNPNLSNQDKVFYGALDAIGIVGGALSIASDAQIETTAAKFALDNISGIVEDVTAGPTVADTLTVAYESIEFYGDQSVGAYELAYDIVHESTYYGPGIVSAVESAYAEISNSGFLQTIEAIVNGVSSAYLSTIEATRAQLLAVLQSGSRASINSLRHT